MTQPDDRSESFIVRIWLEHREIAGALPVWRGMIEHVTSGKRMYVSDLDHIVVFMADYVRAWGVELKSWALLREKLHRLNPRNLLKRDHRRTRRCD